MRATAAAAFLLAGWAASTVASAADTKTLRIVLDQELRVLDPTFTTTYAARDHGFFVYDQLFALDAKGQPKPQMVDGFTVSDDKLTYTFTLRENLAFHDGAPVRAADAVASIRRWALRDPLGQTMMAATADLAATDARTFRLTLKEPFNAVLSGLAKNSGYPLLVMPERVAGANPSQPLTDATGSGPYVFKRDEWRPGNKAVYVRNPAYKPRPEPADGLAGGKAAKFERVEWVSMPDANTAVSALQAGEIDFVGQPPLDFLAMLGSNPDIKLAALSPLGGMFVLRMNSVQPPFDNPKVRQALLPAIDQLSIVQSTGAPKGDYEEFCPSMFMCGGPNESRAGIPPGFGKPDYARARALLAEAGYKGERVLLLQPTDHPVLSPATAALAASLRKAGLNIELAPMDFQSIVMRRTKTEPVSQGGWSMMIAFMSQSGAENPLTQPFIATPCPNTLYGFLCDGKLEALKADWARTTDPAEAKEIVDRIQTRAYEVLPMIPLGQIRSQSAYRADLKGIQSTVVPVFWNVER